MKGISGGIVATLGVVSPSLIIITLITALITNFSQLEIVQHALRGIQVAVCVLMFTAIEKLLKKGVVDIWTFLIFAAAFLLSYFTDLSTVILVVLAGIAGYVMFVTKSRKKGGEQA